MAKKCASAEEPLGRCVFFVAKDYLQSDAVETAVLSDHRLRSIWSLYPHHARPLELVAPSPSPTKTKLPRTSITSWLNFGFIAVGFFVYTATVLWPIREPSHILYASSALHHLPPWNVNPTRAIASKKINERKCLPALINFHSIASLSHQLYHLSTYPFLLSCCALHNHHTSTFTTAFLNRQVQSATFTKRCSH